MNSKIKSFFSREKLLLKFFSISVAIVIWLIVNHQQKENYEGAMQISVPVIYQNIPKNLAFKDKPPDSIQISFKNIAFSENLDPGNFKILIDLKNALPGKNKFIIEKKSVIRPEGIEIERILPKVLFYELEYLLTKNVPIRPVFIGELKKNYVLDSVQIFPNSLKIKGPQSKIEKIEYLQTEEISLSNIDFDFSLNTKVAIFPGYESFEGDLFTPLFIKITVGSRPLSRTMENIRVELKNTKYITKINPKEVNISLYGPEDKIKNLLPDQMKVIVDLRGYMPGKYKIKPVFGSDPTIQVKQIWPVVDVWILDQLKEIKNNSSLTPLAEDK